MRGLLAVACGLALIWGLVAFIHQAAVISFGSP